MLCSLGLAAFAFRRAQEFELVACTMVKNQNRFMPEWLTFHQLQGVSRFVVYDDGSDSPELYLRDFVESGAIEIISWRGTPGCAAGAPTFPGCQVSALEDCVDRYRDAARWIGFWDVDEFLFAPGSSLVRVLRDQPMAAVFRFSGLSFGANNVTHHENAKGLVVPLITPVLTGRAPDDPDGRAGNHKEIGVACLLNSTNVHSFSFTRRGDRNCAVDFGKLDDPVRFNHYKLRSAEDTAVKAVINNVSGYAAPGFGAGWTVQDEAAVAYGKAVRCALLPTLGIKQYAGTRAPCSSNAAPTAPYSLQPCQS